MLHTVLDVTNEYPAFEFRQMALSPPAALDAAFTTPTNARHAPATSGLLVTYSAELTREVRSHHRPRACGVVVLLSYKWRRCRALL